MILTCSKRYDDLPFAHRQPNHDGHCAWIHGHNWSFEFEFAADTPDECGFVIDFGKLKWLRAWIEERFDHTLVLNEDDPHLPYLRSALDTQPGDRGVGPFAKIIALPDCSSEGLSRWLFETVNSLLAAQTDGRVSVVKVRVIEDSRNSATYSA
jgi:6-pyruvoyltetrahydropterin/6-carboxytetrahydropterin synthase